jgi:alpha-L-rhamnosidase
MNVLNASLWLLVLGAFGSSVPIRAQIPTAVHLQTQSVSDPPAVGTLQPRLSWWGKDARPGARQTGFQIEIWTMNGQQGSPRDIVYRGTHTTSVEQTIVVPAGLLRAKVQYSWRVRLWDERLQSGPWSASAHFGTGPLAPGDWRDARWIGYRDDARWSREWKERKAEEFAKYKDSELTPVVTSAHMTSWQLLDSVTPRYDPEPLLRKSFAVGAPVLSAHLYISGVGYALTWINGRRLDDSVLDPGWTNYQKDVLYRTYDVTQQLQRGENTLGVELGRGFYGMLANDRWGFATHAPWIGQPALKALLEIRYRDGRTAEITTDGSWKVHAGPILYDDPWLGEVYDARDEQNGWTGTRYNDRAWEFAHLIGGPAGALRPQIMPPVRPAAIIHPLSVKQTQPGVWNVDVGVNTAGWMRLTVEGHAGDRVLVQMAEKPDPVTFIDRTPNNFQQFGYVLKGGGDEVAESHFSYMGFRYVRITASGSYGPPPRVKAIVAVPVHTDVASAGSWQSSNELLNSINRVWRRTQLNNLDSIPTDCPHREKLGWMADSFIAQPAALYSFNPEAFYENFAIDLAGTQSPQGTLSTIAPSFGYTEGASPLWASAEVWIPWRLYLYDGNRDVLREQFPVIRRFLDATLANNAIGGKPFVIRDVLGDWDSPGHENPPEGNEPYSTAYYFLDCRLLAKMARVLGEETAATEFDARAESVKQAFNLWFYSPSDGIYQGFKPTEYRQSINALALWAGLVPSENRAVVYAHLRQDVLAHDSHLNTGIIGTKPLLEVLADAGDADLVYTVAAQQTYPSWGNMIVHGATTMWESWDGHDSLDHPMQGTVVEFFYRYLAGLRADEKHPGFAEFDIQPIFPDGLSHVQASFDSPRGTIVSSWQREGSSIVLHVSVPFNTVAHLALPEQRNTACVVAAQEGLTAEPASADNSSGAQRYILPSGDHWVHLVCAPASAASPQTLAQALMPPAERTR